MSFIFHHDDDDGRCAAAIVYNDMCQRDPFIEDNIYEYTYGTEMPSIDIDKIHPSDTLYFVDISLSTVVFQFIKSILIKFPAVKVVYIDHHKTTNDYLEYTTFSKESLDILQRITFFIKQGVSASILAWVYSCMSNEERKNPNKYVWDATATYSHIGIGTDLDSLREYRVPMVVRFINDWDVWNHEISGTRAFHYGFMTETDKSPSSKLWVNLIYNEDSISITRKYLTPGETIVAIKDGESKHIIDTGWEYPMCFNGEMIKIFVVNARGDSFMFGDKLDKYPAVCMFWRTKDMWEYSFRSNAINGIDVSKLCKSLGGGGHIHAAGFKSKDLMFVL